MRRLHAAETLEKSCVGIPALLQGTIKLRRSAAARRLTASLSPGDHGTLLDPPCLPSLPTGTQSAVVSTNPPQPARGVPRVRDPEVVEGPTRPICPPSDPVSCLPHPRDVVPAPLPYQDITHRTHIGLKPHSESPGGSCLPFCACGCFSQVRPADTPRAAAASDSSCAAFFEMPEVLGSTGSWSFCCRLGGAAGSQRLRRRRL